MNIADGKVVIDVILDDGSVKKGVADIGSQFNGLENSGSGAAVSIGKIVTALGLVGLAKKGIDMVKQSLEGAITRYDTLNQFPRVMKMMGFDAEESEAAIGKLSDGIDGLPTTLDSVASTAQNIAVLTGDLDGAVDTTLALNNAFLSSGASSEDAERGLQQYVQMLSRGEVDLQSWRTLQETMGPALNKTAEAFGFTGKAAQTDLYDALKDGDITFDQFNDKLIELSNGVGGFADMASEGSAGIATSWKNMKTAIVKGVADVIGAVDKALGGTGEIEVIIDRVKNAVSDAFAWIVGIIPTVAEAIISISKAAKEVYESIKPWLPLIAAIAAGVGTFLLIANAVTIVSAAVGTAVSVFNMAKAAILAVRVAMITLNSAMLANPIALVVAAIVAAAALIYVYWDPIKDFFIMIWEGIKIAGLAIWEALKIAWAETVEFFTSLWQSVSEFFADLWQGIQIAGLVIWEVLKEAWAETVEFFKALWEPIAEFFSTLWQGIQLAGILIWDMLKEAWTTAVEFLKELFSPIVEFFAEIFGNIFETISNIWDSITETLSTVWTNIQTMASAAWEIIKNMIMGPILLLINLLTGDFEAFKENLAAIWQNISEAASTIWNALKSSVSAIVTGFVNSVKSFIEGLKTHLSTIWNAISSTATSVWNALKSAVSAVVSGLVSAVTGFISGLASGLSALWNGISSAASSIWNGLKAAVSAVVSGLVSAVTGFISGLSSTLSGLWSGISSAASSIWSGMVSAVTGIVNGMINGLSSAWESAKTMTSDAFNAVVDFIKSPLEGINLLSIGQNIVQGLINGIKNKVRAVKDAVKSVTSAITGKIKGVLGIASPSKVTTELGEFTGEGMEKGIGSMAKKVDRASGKLAESAIPDMVSNRLRGANIDIPGVVPVSASSGNSNGNSSSSNSSNSLLVEQNQKLSEMIKLLSMNKDVYIDGDKVTDTVNSNNAVAAVMNKFGG